MNYVRTVELFEYILISDLSSFKVEPRARIDSGSNSKTKILFERKKNSEKKNNYKNAALKGVMFVYSTQSTLMKHL